MNITREQFRKIYAGTRALESEELLFQHPHNAQDMKANYFDSKLWRLNNLYTIVDKQGHTVPFVMNQAQHKVYAESLKHSRVIILKSRQQGISTFWLISFFDDCITMPNLSSGLMAQGLDEAGGLLTKVKTLWDELPDWVKKHLNISKESDSTSKMSFSNKSKILIATSFRGTTLHRLHVSEVGKIAKENPQRIVELKTGSLQTIAPGLIVVLESTAEGENDFKEMYYSAVKMVGSLSITPMDFLPVFLPWTDDFDCVMDIDQESSEESDKYFLELQETTGIVLTREQKNFWLTKFRELDTKIYQEFPATAEEAFLVDRGGTYYATMYLKHIKRKERVGTGLYDPNLPVYVAFDLGMNDDMVMIFFQTFTDGWRIINSYNNNSQPIEYYCQYMDDMKDQYGYKIEQVVLPWDAAEREMTSNLTREQAFHQYGYKNTSIVPRTKDINNDRELVRRAIKRMWIDTDAQYIIDCMMNYSKERDKNLKVWKDKHRHDEFSHGADALRYMVRSGLEYREPTQTSIKHGGYVI